MKIKVVTILSALALMAMFTTANAADVSSFHFKTGNFNLSDTAQTIGGVSVTIDESASSVYALEYEATLSESVTWGVEVITYSNDITSGSSANLDSVHAMVNVRKYFDATTHVKPYVGAGFGANVVTIIGSGSGFSFQGLAGIKFPFDKIAAVLEYKVISAEAEDQLGATVDVSGNGIFAGIAFSF